jgi:hypothetical protein
MVSVWPEPPFARLAGVCAGMEALALRGATIDRQVFLYCGSTRAPFYRCLFERLVCPTHVAVGWPSQDPNHCRLSQVG